MTGRTVASLLSFHLHFNITCILQRRTEGPQEGLLFCYEGEYMNGVNRVFMAGRLGTNPNLETSKNGRPYCKLRLAINKTYTPKNGEPQKEVQWHSIIVWGQQANSCCQYLAKGSTVAIEGYLDNYTVETEQGETIWKSSIVAQQVHFLKSNNADRKVAV